MLSPSFKVHISLYMNKGEPRLLRPLLASWGAMSLHWSSTGPALGGSHLGARLGNRGCRSKAPDCPASSSLFFPVHKTGDQGGEKGSRLSSNSLMASHHVHFPLCLHVCNQILINTSLKEDGDTLKSAFEINLSRDLISELCSFHMQTNQFL